MQAEPMRTERRAQPAHDHRRPNRCWIHSLRLLSRRLAVLAALVGACLTGGDALQAEEDVYLKDVPDYDWYSACFGTACGNLIGFWDRHGLPDFYKGPTENGVAPLTAWWPNQGIRSLWVSKAGRDGRPASQPGHEDDYYVRYESTAPDPYITLGRKEHTPDCIGDFIGLNQLKWTNMNGECDGNIDGYVFAYWDKTGAQRWNYTPSSAAGEPAVDLQSGLRAWSAYCGYEADTFTQMASFSPEVTQAGRGFQFADLKAEIDAGYPLLLMLQNPQEMYHAVGSMARANPEIHGMLVYGYHIDDGGTPYARVRTSWGTGDEFREWGYLNWTPSLGIFLSVRGVIGFHPKPRILSMQRQSGTLTLVWHGPSADLVNAMAGMTFRRHWYVVERSTALGTDPFVAVTPPSVDMSATIPVSSTGQAFFRVRIVGPQ